MMFELLGQWLFSTVTHCITDIIVFIIVDAAVKNVIRESSSEDEKQRIWLFESFLLILASLLIYWLYYVPALLFLLAFVTLIYTQFLRDVPLREYTRRLMTSWDDHLHHADNVRIIKEKIENVQHQQRLQQVWGEAPQASKPVLQKISDLVFRKAMNSKPAPIKGLGDQFERYKAEDMARKNSHLTANKMPQYSPVLQKPITPPVSNAPAQNFHSQTSSINHLQLDKNAQNNWYGRVELKRRPLHPQKVADTSNGNFSGQTRNLRNKFMSAFGYSTSIDKPSGIRNEGQNLCFINSVLQCLARTPNFAQLLACSRKEEMNCSLAESQLLDTLSELLLQCSKVKASVSVLDTCDLRQCLALLTRQGLVAPPTERQHQQDVAEFFTSLTETVHSILKKTVNKGKPSTNSSLSMLRFIYGDLTPTNIEKLKDACKKEISEANGLNNESYAEPIQQLADLEWLTHKQNNQTLIDEKFTGQMVSATHCMINHHLTVSTQAFNILPVPIVPPRDLSGLVYLEDCFTRYCNIEHLLGKEGIDCDFCNKMGVPQHPALTPTLPGSNIRTTRSTRGSCLNSHQTMGNTDSGMYSPRTSTTYMSPIVGNHPHMNDSGFHDNVFRTSTPVSETNLIYPQRVCLRDAERRCLLRQLPDCLVIQLMRFTYNQVSQQPRKISASVSIPLIGLDLKSVIFDNVTNRPALVESDQKYDLYAVCVHLGGESMHSGHYVCYCQSGNGVWYKFDDDLVWDVNMEYEITTKEIRENAYLLFYKRT